MELKKTHYGYFAITRFKRYEWRFALRRRQWELHNPYFSLSFKQREFPTLKAAYHAALAYQKDDHDAAT